MKYFVFSFLSELYRTALNSELSFYLNSGHLIFVTKFITFLNGIKIGVTDYSFNYSIIKKKKSKKHQLKVNQIIIFFHIILTKLYS